VKRFADGLDVRLQMVVPPSHADLVPWLLQGKGDVIAASYTVTPDRAKHVAFSVPYLEIQELLVQRASEPLLKSVDDLRGRRIRVRPGSSYLATLERLRAKGAHLTIELARPTRRPSSSSPEWPRARWTSPWPTRTSTRPSGCRGRMSWTPFRSSPGRRSSSPSPFVRATAS
jgi:membrane-bound lytic murein transglycosylase F